MQPPCLSIAAAKAQRLPLALCLAVLGIQPTGSPAGLIRHNLSAAPLRRPQPRPVHAPLVRKKSPETFDSVNLALECGSTPSKPGDAHPRSVKRSRRFVELDW